MPRFKDKCDICHTFQYCRGYKDNMIICDECRKSIDEKKNTKYIRYIQLAINEKGDVIDCEE